MEKENLYLNCSFFNTSWDNGLMDHQNDPFESALSSMVCSPTASNAANSGGCNFNGQHIVIKELIGRLGGICNSGEISAANGGGGADASCYSTPLNSPRRINSSGVEKQRIRESLPEIRGGGFSCFTNNSLVTDPGPDRGKIYECPTFAPQQQALNAAPGDSIENSSLSELIPANPRKRKAPAKGRGKETSAIPPAKQVNAPSESYAKRCKSEENRSYSEKGDAIKVKPGVNHKQQKEDSKAPEPPKDYIHVRARRGQATDAHSLAERVRREKISERMRILQDLVPGCNKIAGKAVMLDEIINYVQSLQRQVEFLSMKLATVTPRMDYNMETAVVKDMCQARGLFNHYANPSESYCIHSQTNLHGAMPISNNHRKQSPPMEIYSETTSRVSMFLEDDLHTVVHMGFREDESQEFPGVLKPTQMKIEH